ncbi:S8 family peptidase [Acinetobacter haemolyticus]|uniref:S8 family peptidase n=1 Tax=unclassified Acinetobacter TaxID=196816 RepID=UPI0015D2E497|nr:MULTISPECIES: S8 family peptidase [unclassified Acinetobacter]MDD2945768.1 S8 family serine peptidase [Acinetobacter sp.]UDM39429.1 S8 family peptidase [Acinetobacter haemolyticus]
MNRIHKISIFAASSAVAVLAYAVSTPSNKAATTAVKQDQVLTNQQVSTPSTTTANSSPTVLAPTLTSTTTASPIKNQYIVVLQAGSDLPAQAAAAIAKQHGGQVLFTYNRAIRGFAVRIPEQATSAFLTAMQKNPQVSYVEEDTLMQTNTITQSNPVWGLDRIDQHNLPLSKSFNYNKTGSGVNAYIVDTGILASHQEFNGRVQTGYSAIADNNGTNDCNGHGTHVAGTVGGSTYGIAKNVGLVPVRVLDCAGSGAMSGVIAGLDWIIQNGRKSAVVNMSLGGSAYSTLDTAIDNLFNNGYVPVVAAGNSNTDACTSSPARAGKAITVAATDSTDTRASYSNYGSCVDLFAPGSQITSAWIGSNSSAATASGTSMASPHVAGVVATMLENNSTATPQSITDQLLNQSTINLIQNPMSSPNRLLYNLIDTQTITPVPSIIAHISKLNATTLRYRNGTWRANVTISVVDSNNLAVPNATVTGSFSVGGSNLNCTTNSLGQCQINSGTIKSATQTTFNVNNISGSNLTYAASSNLVSSITIYR